MYSINSSETIGGFAEVFELQPVRAQTQLVHLGTCGAFSLLVTDELVRVQDFRGITNRFRGICGIYLEFVKEKRKDRNM